MGGTCVTRAEEGMVVCEVITGDTNNKHRKDRIDELATCDPTRNDGRSALFDYSQRLIDENCCDLVNGDCSRNPTNAPSQMDPNAPPQMDPNAPPQNPANPPPQNPANPPPQDPANPP